MLCPKSALFGFFVACTLGSVAACAFQTPIEEDKGSNTSPVNRRRGADGGADAGPGDPWCPCSPSGDGGSDASTDPWDDHFGDGGWWGFDAG
jgi:hypothetical protein